MIWDPMIQCTTSPFWFHSGFTQSGTARTAACWGQSNTSFVSLYSKCKSSATLMVQTTFARSTPGKSLG